MLLIDDWISVFAATKEVSKLSLPVYKNKNLRISFQGDKILDHEPVYGGQKPILPFAASDVYMASIVSWRRLTAISSDCKDVYEITFDIKNSNFTFQAGDTIGILPQNVASEVNAVLQHLGLSDMADYLYKLNVNKPSHIPVESTLRYVLTHCVDLRCIMKKQFLLALSTFTEDETEKRTLEYLSSKEGKQLYDELILAKKMCILDIFKIFKTCKPEVEVLLQNCTRLLPRPYSIVNSGKNDSSILKICFSVIDVTSNRKGLTTSGLERILLNESEKDGFNLIKEMENLNIDNKDLHKVPLYLRNNMSGFGLPENVDAPLILIGPGTGIAPFIGFLEERMMLSTTSDIWVFFGCRNPKLDFIYEEEMQKFLDKGVLTKLSTAFSRIESHCKYVQDSISLNAKEVSKLIERGAYIFVCGDQNEMTKQVEASLIDCIVQHQNKNVEEAKTMLLDMKKQKQYVVDVWS